MNAKPILLLMFIITSCNTKNVINKKKTLEYKNVQVYSDKQEVIIDEYLNECAKNYNYKVQMNLWQDCLDRGLEKDSTISELWQKKAMPFFKARKYEIGMKYIDKAVLYNPKIWQPYRAFIKCIFAKRYTEAIDDFEDCLKNYGNIHVMDHRYKFYIGLSYLQLNEFDKADKIFTKEIEEQVSEWGDVGYHSTELFYLAIVKYELQQWEEAIKLFDDALKLHPNFSDALYYKSVCLLNLGRTKDSQILYEQAKKYGKDGYTLNEDNVIYETYPYQVRWRH